MVKHILDTGERVEDKHNAAVEDPPFDPGKVEDQVRDSRAAFEAQGFQG